ncbi:chorismate-binding protein [Nocardioides sp.]|uniref:chorismate-binding protein n=1 Tax=Nocardioides sp. TaxID=35761 RepID=UPI002604B2A6|nr:chorismate-binding protein [Nocardioides sp.]MCW2735556.1 Aminodeoxychorismate synthase component [Nocardioides sp.]
MDGFDPSICAPPGHPGGPLRELERLEWRSGDGPDAAAALAEFLAEHGLGGEPAAQTGDTSVVLLIGASGCAAVGDVPAGPPTPVPGVPDLVAVAVRGEASAPAVRRPAVGEWQPSWSPADHAAAVSAVREAIARGDVYQANVVGHRSAPHRSSPADLAVAVAGIGAAYAGVLTGEGWAVGSASPEQLVRVAGGRVTTEPIKGTRRIASGSFEELRASEKDRAEHVMIVDLERNDLARVAVTGSVEVETLYDVAEWAGLWHAASTVAAELDAGVDVVTLLRAVLPGGSVTGAPKHAACVLLASLEPVGRGPAMGAFGIVRPGGLDLGLTIRTVAVDADRVHVWAGGGITWGSDPDEEVAEAEAKAGPVLRALGR